MDIPPLAGQLEFHPPLAGISELAEDYKLRSVPNILWEQLFSFSGIVFPLVQSLSPSVAVIVLAIISIDNVITTR